MTKERPLILVTNDDGIQAKGIRSLVEVASSFGEVVIVAPVKPQSGMGHAITMSKVLRLIPFHLFEGLLAYHCSGTPVDCVKLAISEVIKRKPDIILSGINHGDNSASNVIYSGTMSAAVEGAMENIPSIGFSLLDFDEDADFNAAKWAVKEVLSHVVEGKFPEHICLNVNIPKLPLKEIKGIKICRQSKAFWKDSFIGRKDQFGRPYFWMKGEFNNEDREEDSDILALEQGYVSVVPIQYDLTAYHAIEEIRKWNL